MSKPIAILLNDPFADWETGFLSASARDYFDAEVLHFSPDGGDVGSEGGLVVRPNGAFDDVVAAELSAVIVCGSQSWTAPVPIDIGSLLLEAEAGCVLIGAICAGTVTVGRSGLLSHRRHTSNNRDWFTQVLGAYGGENLYEDTNGPVEDRGVITAPASAPAAFAGAVLSRLYDGHPALPDTLAMLSKAR